MRRVLLHLSTYKQKVCKLRYTGNIFIFLDLSFIPFDVIHKYRSVHPPSKHDFVRLLVLRQRFSLEYVYKPGNVFPELWADMSSL